MSSTSALGFDVADWPRISSLLDQALAQPPSQRDAWLQALEPADQRLRSALASLLRGAAASDPELPALEPAEHDDRRSGDVVGPYRLLRPLGRGGMGSVWLAQRSDGVLQRPVALKLPHGGGTRPGLAERLARERDLLASLAHPHIAALYDAGIAERGQPYLALELVSGERIDRHCEARHLGVPERLRLFLQAARAVAHAHSQLIVHRDLKPSNLMVDEAGQVKLLDFGIAKLLGDTAPADSTLTREGARPMTPDYASPEQVAGLAVDTRSDVYSLGVVLYELLAGTRPYRTSRRTTAALEEAILDAEPPRPSIATADRERARALRGDLDTIVLKALKKQPADRYGTVQALAEDIERHLQRRPVMARPDSPGYVLRRLIARHRIAFAASAAAVLLVLAAAAAALWQAHRAELERQRAGEVKEFLTRLLRDAGPYRPAAANTRMAGVVSRLVREAAPGAGAGDVAPIRAVDLLQRAARQLEADPALQPAVKAELRVLVGVGLMNFGDLAAARPIVAQGVDEARRALGDDHPGTLRAQLVQVKLQRLDERGAQAQQQLEALLPALRRHAREQPELLVEGLQAQAQQALDGSRHDEAERLGREALVLAENSLAPAHPETIASATLVSMASRLGGRHEAARAAAERAIADARRAYGDEPHPQSMEALAAAARAHAELDDAAAAARAFLAAAAQGRSLFGSASPIAALLQAQAVPYLLESGAWRDADAASDEAVRAFARFSGAAHFPRALAASARAAVLLALHDQDAALPLIDSASAVLTRIGADNSSFAVAAAAQRVQALLRQGRLDAAAAAAQALTSEVNGPRAPLVRLQREHARAALAVATGDRAAAREQLQALIDTAGRTPGARREALLARLTLAAAMRADGDAGAAQAAYGEALSAAEQLEREPGPLQAEALLGLALSDTAAGAANEALPRLRRAQAIWQGARGGPAMRDRIAAAIEHARP